MTIEYPIKKVLELVCRQVEGTTLPSVTLLSQRTRNPFVILVSTILSSRTKDATTLQATERLFLKISNSQELSQLKEHDLRRLIYPVGFYRNKARLLINMAQHLNTHFQGWVPDTLTELLTLPGVGRKTANLVLSLGFAKQAICVDTHVHRITNRWGYVHTQSPFETEQALRQKLPHEWWIPINTLLVRFGQILCRPLSPFCSHCPIEHHCSKVGVTSHR